MKKVLITGGAGFIGFHLAKKLVEAGHSVDLVDNYSRGVVDNELKTLSLQPGVKLINRDLLKEGSLDDLGNYEQIYHLAAIIGVANVLSRSYEVLRYNVEMVTNVISFAEKQKNLKRLIFASTSEVYAGTLKYFELPIPTPENTPLALTDLEHPRTSYMLSKIYGEALCRQSSLPYTIIRPHNIYGPRMGLSHVIPELLCKAYKAQENDKFDLFSPNHRRTFCFIDDAVQLLIHAASAEKCEKETLNIGSEDSEITMRNLAEIVIKTVNKKVSFNEMPATSGSPERRCPDMTKTKNLTGYSSKIDLEEGVKKTFSWYRENIFEGGGLSAK